MIPKGPPIIHFGSQVVPKGPPKVPMGGPRRSQVLPKGHPKVQFIVFGLDLGGIWAPKWAQSCLKVTFQYFGAIFRCIIACRNSRIGVPIQPNSQFKFEPGKGVRTAGQPTTLKESKAIRTDRTESESSRTEPHRTERIVNREQ